MQTHTRSTDGFAWFCPELHVAGKSGSIDGVLSMPLVLSSGLKPAKATVALNPKLNLQTAIPLLLSGSKRRSESHPNTLIDCMKVWGIGFFRV